MYSIESELAKELRIQASPARHPPANTMIRGPKRSTRYPSAGTSQVSNSTNSVNATWIEARFQPCFWLIGIVKSVQPYWRLAIITMQMMPMISWVQRVASETRTAGRSVCEMAAMGELPRARLGAADRSESSPRLNDRNFARVPGNGGHAAIRAPCRARVQER